MPMDDDFWVHLSPERPYRASRSDQFVCVSEEEKKRNRRKITEGTEDDLNLAGTDISIQIPFRGFRAFPSVPLFLFSRRY